MMKVREIFYSLQGEGGRAGEASIFIRLANCNLNCWFCDTDWSTGEDMTLHEIYDKIKDFPSKWIVWTGGEPTLQLTEGIVTFFKNAGFKQAIETNGTRRIPDGLDYVVCSPKIPFTTIDMLHVNLISTYFRKIEFRFPLSPKEELPYNIKNLPTARHYFVSPLFMGMEKKRLELDELNLQYCVNFVKENPKWKLSVQQHKIWNIL